MKNTQFGVPKITILGPEIVQNQTQVGFGVPGGSKIDLTRCVATDLGDFEVILGSQNEPESVQNRC